VGERKEKGEMGNKRRSQRAGREQTEEMRTVERRV